jgi:hypothetical protein
VQGGNNSPGAIYEPKEEFGAHPERSNWTHDKKLKPSQGNGMTQGPGKFYNVREDVGQPAQGRKPNVQFGKSQRFWVPGEHLTIGPGQYQHKSTLEAGRKAKSFGASVRAYDHVKYQDGELSFKGRNSPGPGPYRQDFGKDCISHPMGLAKKLPRVKLSDTPDSMGPGYYSVTNLKRGVESSDNQSGGVSFGRPRRKKHRFDFKKLGQCGNRVFGHF